MTQTNATALSKRIEWTKEEIQDDRKELAKTLEALSDTAGERGPLLPGEPAPDAVAGDGARAGRSRRELRALDREKAGGARGAPEGRGMERVMTTAAETYRKRLFQIQDLDPPPAGRRSRSTSGARAHAQMTGGSSATSRTSPSASARSPRATSTAGASGSTRRRAARTPRSACPTGGSSASSTHPRAGTTRGTASTWRRDCQSTRIDRRTTVLRRVAVRAGHLRRPRRTTKNAKGSKSARPRRPTEGAPR